MKGLVRSRCRMSCNILLLGLLQWAILSQLSTVPTDAAKADLAAGRKMREKAELEGSMFRYQHIIAHDKFSLRSLLKVQTKKIEKHQDVVQEKIAEQNANEHTKERQDIYQKMVEKQRHSKLDLKESKGPEDESQVEHNTFVHKDEKKVPEVERQSEGISIENLKSVKFEKTIAQQQNREIEGQEGVTENQEFQQQQRGKQESEEKTQGKEEPHKVEQEQQQRDVQNASDDSKTEEQQKPRDRQNVAEEKHNIENEETEEPQSNTEKQQESREGQNVAEEKNSAEEEEPFVIPEPPHVLGPIIKDWDEQRGSWLNANEHMKTTPDGKPRVLIVTGSQPEPCHSSLGDNLNIKSLKLKIDYARMHNYEIYYNVAWLDPLFGGFWVKLPTIRTLMLTHPEIEWFFWVDSDAMFTDMLFEAPFETYEGYNMVMWGINDYFYAEKSWTAFNAGVFMIRNCQWTLDLIDKWSPMGPEGEHRDAYGKLLTKFLKGRGDWAADDQSALAYLMLTDEAVKAKVKLVDSPEYMISGWWVPIVDTYEDLMEKYHPGLGNNRWPWITHFTGCGPCYHNDTTPEYKICMENMDRAFHFADNQVLAYMGFQHESLSSPEVIPLRIETDRPLELHGVNPWADRIAEVAAMEGGSPT